MSFRSLSLRAPSVKHLKVIAQRRKSAFDCLRLRSYATEVRIGSGVKPATHGQPWFSSHPHLLKPDETTPGITSAEYERRRSQLMESLPHDSVVVLIAGQVKYMSGQIFYKFRQASDFWYLTGIEEPDAAVMLEKNSSPRGYHMTIFYAGERDSKWDGASLTSESAKEDFKADEVEVLSAFAPTLKNRIAGRSHIYLDVPSSLSSRRERPKSLLHSGKSHLDYEHVIESIQSNKRKPLASIVAKLRSVKSEAEQRVMRAAADISGRAHAKTMRFAAPGKSEHILAAHFEYTCAVEGAQRPAYVPVVGSGPNALTIHYTANNQLINEGDLVLLDAGCEYNGYASDITRTFPASGTFTTAQATLYSALLTTQKYLITLCAESANLSLAQLHRESCSVLHKELNKIGFNLHGAEGSNRLERTIYPHFVGHPIGIDLHESNHFDRHAPLKAGMVITVEPGLYVPAHSAFPAEFHNMGIRIEDEVLVGKDHPTILSVNAPKEIADVEGACQGSLGLEPF